MRIFLFGLGIARERFPNIAKLRKDDKSNAASEKLAALRRVSNAVKFDLFAWSDQHKV